MRTKSDITYFDDIKQINGIKNYWTCYTKGNYTYKASSFTDAYTQASCNFLYNDKYCSLIHFVVLVIPMLFCQ